MILLWLIFFFTNPFISSAAVEESSLTISLKNHLIDHQSPQYHGVYESNGLPFDFDYFVQIPSVDFSSEAPNSFLDKLSSDDLVLKVFEYLDNDLVHLSKLAFKSKRLYRLLCIHFTRKFFRFNPQIFWLLPAKTRLRFAAKFLRKFEDHFPGLKGNVNLSLNDLTGLIYLLLHCENVLYICSSDLDLLHDINPYYQPSSDPYQYHLPYQSSAVWRTMIFSRAIQKDAFYTIEASCKLDPKFVTWFIELLTHKIGISETKYNELITTEIKLLLNQIVLNNPDALKSLLGFSVTHGAISAFSHFLQYWTDDLNEITFDPNEDHIILRIADNRLNCPEILSRPDLPTALLSLTLFRCKEVGNWLFATELLSNFDPETFSSHFDQHDLILMNRIINAPVALTRTALNIPLTSHLPLALLLASFHFQQPAALITFRRLIRGHLDEEVLEELLCKRTRIYYEIAISTKPKSTIDFCRIF